MLSRLSDTLAALRAMLVANVTLAGLLGGEHVYLRMSSEGIERYPGVYYTILDHTIGENFETVFVRWEIWAETMLDVLAIERQMIVLLNNDGPVALGGATCTLQIESMYEAPDTTRSDIFRRNVESKLEIVRLRASA